MAMGGPPSDAGWMEYRAHVIAVASSTDVLVAWVIAEEALSRAA